MKVDLRYLVYGPEPKPIWLRPVYVVLVGCILLARIQFGFDLVAVLTLAILGTLAVHGICALLAKD